MVKGMVRGAAMVKNTGYAGKFLALVFAVGALSAAPVSGAVREFENVSIDVPEGWQAEEQREDGGVILVSPGSSAVLTVSVAVGDAEGGDSKTYAEALSDEQKGTVPRDVGNGRYAFTVRNDYGKLGHLSAWVDRDTGFAVMAMGKHPELEGVVASVKIRGEHPDLEGMWAVLDSAGDFGHFSADVPGGWTAEDNDDEGGVTFTPPGMEAICMVLTVTPEEGEDTEFFANGMAEFWRSQGMEAGTPEKTEGEFYRIPCINAEGVTGYLLVGVEDGIGDTVFVMGEHKDLKTLLRSLKAGYRRNQLAKMFKEAGK
jgi:hypothetical protein